jgi:glycosyltransferase involved in cell wall biosynthesis
MAYDAFSLLVPDIFVDTMGYAFALGLCKLMFPKVPTGAYVHYPTISTDMLASLDSTTNSTYGVNAGKGAGARGAAKKIYWEIFAKVYGWVGSSIDVVMTNSTWTQGHIRSLWGGFRAERGVMSDIAVVYPPVAVEELESEIEISAESEKKRSKTLLYIAQFRPEKNHTLILNSFAEFMRTKTPATKGAKLVLVGSVRDDSDSKRVYELRLLANELQIKDSVEFHLDASWPEILEWLRKASVGVNGMWNEHFGIGVVEYQAAGLVAVVHKSGGPKIDIVTEVEGKPTGESHSISRPFLLVRSNRYQGSMRQLRLNSPKGSRRLFRSRIHLTGVAGHGCLHRGLQKRNLRRGSSSRWRRWCSCRLTGRVLVRNRYPFYRGIPHVEIAKKKILACILCHLVGRTLVYCVSVPVTRQEKNEALELY